MPEHTWDSLIAERRTAPPALDGERFRAWMAAQRIFVSSPMDNEMSPARAAVAAFLRQHGATPVMWEAITPQDRRAEDAFLDGVDTSSLFVLLLGSRYGQSDATGYSPTHKEANRAHERGLPRLLFERVMAPAERAGKLNDWLGSLYHELSGARYTTPDDLVAQLDQRLREIAGGQDSHWVKLGNLVFPATVRQRSQQGTTSFHIRATLRDAPVRHAVRTLGQGAAGGGFYAGRREIQLTWGHDTHAVRVESVDVHSTAVSADDVEIRCIATGQVGQHTFAALGGINFSGPSGTIGPAEQVRMWADLALFGATPPARHQRDSWIAGFVAPEGPPLPHVLDAAGARGWLAEGLTRLYAVEGLAAKFGGRFERLDVGPATATGVSLHGRYRLPSLTPAAVDLIGTVPLPATPASQRR